MRDADLKVRCGEWDLHSRSEPLPPQDRGVVAAAAHPAFSAKNLTNNVALLFTDQPFAIGRNS